MDWSILTLKWKRASRQRFDKLFGVVVTQGVAKHNCTSAGIRSKDSAVNHMSSIEHVVGFRE